MVNLNLAPKEYLEEYRKGVVDTIAYRSGTEEHIIRNYHMGSEVLNYLKKHR
ncbi:hypothetical protein GCM10011413_12470 [Pedobacter psychrotolerans]|uniref:Uncharacterized protein n=1 Tax=Pedobacter psychrotolerans TaxID=1843235 RepID=A0ABQ1SM35_9SPHI|nr:hypothetical protein GCM10011413_12470 [Pedobacter psychrotolerans]